MSIIQCSHVGGCLYCWFRKLPRGRPDQYFGMHAEHVAKVFAAAKPPIYARVCVSHRIIIFEKVNQNPGRIVSKYVENCVPTAGRQRVMAPWYVVMNLLDEPIFAVLPHVMSIHVL